MSSGELHMHYVCTHDEAQKLIAAQDKFWVSNCGCRESKGHCSRSRIDVCLVFKSDIGASGSGLKEMSPAEVSAIMEEAKNKHLVTRPFRNMKEQSETEGICFCCDDCCGYFNDPNEISDKGKFIAAIDEESCAQCGDCVEVCYSKARDFSGGELLYDSDNCYGCGLCAQVCPEKCIEMAVRN